MELKNPVKSSLSWKLVVIGFLIAVLMVPTGLIAVLVNERQNRQEEAVREVSSKWGNEQTITGPVLSVPYKVTSETTVNGVKKTEESVHYAYFLPETLNIEGMVEPERRSRGIYETVVYTADLKISGEFSAPDLAQFNIKPEQVMGDQARLAIGVPDPRGIKEAITLDWNSQKADMGPGTGEGGVLGGGANTLAKVDTNDKAKRYKYSATISLRGSRDLFFSPLGKTTKVSVASAWASPSFQGAFLPEKREVAETGFSAEWQVLELNRSFPQAWTGQLSAPSGPAMAEPIYYEKMPAAAAGALGGYDFGVRLLIPADEYQKTTRTLKYSILALSLTFLVLFFFEAMNKRQVHPLQYLLIGLALSLFYVLLIAIAEHLGFAWSYLIASGATIGLIALYSKAVFRAWRPAAIESLILAFIYGFIYIILQLEDYSLLVGALGLFAILATVMYVSRKIDWYGLGK